MKKYCLLIIILLFQCSVFAASKSDMPFVKFNGSVFSLFYGAGNKDTDSYINEYYKTDENYNYWSEIIAVHHFPNAYSPVDQAKFFKSCLHEAGTPAILDVDEDANTAILDFVIIDDKKIPVILEFNVFRYKKDKICGTIALQYAKRYVLNNRLDAENVKKTFMKTRSKYIKKVSKLEIPELVEAEIENGVYIKNTANKINEDNAPVIQEELQVSGDKKID